MKYILFMFQSENELFCLHFYFIGRLHQASLNKSVSENFVKEENNFKWAITQEIIATQTLENMETENYGTEINV